MKPFCVIISFLQCVLFVSIYVNCLQCLGMQIQLYLHFYMLLLLRTQNKNKIVIYPFLCRINQYMFYCNIIVLMNVLRSKQSCILEYVKNVNEFLFMICLLCLFTPHFSPLSVFCVWLMNKSLKIRTSLILTCQYRWLSGSFLMFG